MLSHMLATSVQTPQTTVDTVPQTLALNGQCDVQNAKCHIYIHIYIYTYIYMCVCVCVCVCVYTHTHTHTHTQSVPGGMCQTSGGCSLC